MKRLLSFLRVVGSGTKRAKSPFRTVRPVFDLLERRDVPSGVSLEPGGVLTLDGGGSDDKFVIRFISKDLGGGVYLFTYRVRWEHDGLPMQKFNYFASGVKSYVFHGNGGDDTFTNETYLSGQASGGPGSDTLTGGRGSDTLYGGSQADWLQGNEGNDSLRGGLGNDVLFSSYFEIYGGPANPGNDTLDGGDGHDQLVGDSGNDRLFGSSGNDTLMGNAGQDELLGGDDNDKLMGGADSDGLFGQDGFDSLHGGDGGDLIVGGADGDALYGEGGDDILGGEEGNDLLDGGLGSDKLSGGEDQDSLYGGAHSDTLSGEEGDDHLYNRSVFRFDLNEDVWPDAFYGGDGYDWLHDLGQNDPIPGGDIEEIEWA